MKLFKNIYSKVLFCDIIKIEKQSVNIVVKTICKIGVKHIYFTLRIV